MTDLPATAACPRCGCALPRDTPRGLCAKCLFAAMLEDGSVDAPPESTITKSSLPRAFGQYELLEEVAGVGWALFFERANCKSTGSWR